MPRIGITEAAFAAAAAKLQCDIAAIKAVAEVESRGSGFIPSGKPTILFERHKFHKYSGGIFSAANPDISAKKAGGYGPAGEHQWARFSKAFALDARAAMMSCSWGRFQIMGFNFAAAGFASLDDFVTAMKESEDRQLEAFVNFVLSQALAGRLRRHDWAGFARGYNGEDYAINKYDTKLAAAHRKWSATHKSEKTELVAPPTGVSVADMVVEVPENEEIVPEPEPDLADKPEKGEATVQQVSTNPPTVEVKSQGVSMWSKAQALWPTIATAVGGLGLKASGFSFGTVGLLIFGGVVIVCVVVGALLWNAAKNREQERLRWSQENLANRDRVNVVVGTTSGG